MKRSFAVALALLSAVGSLNAQRRPAPLLLNHLYAVLDSATYAEVMASPFLTTQFAGFKSRSPATWFGRHTYLEFFDPRGYDGARAGDVGIALGIEEAGGLAVTARNFAALGVAFDSLTERRGTPQQSQPYFHRFQPAKADAPSPRTAFWVMEYTLEASRALALHDSLPLGDLGRDRFLADRFDSTKLLGDLTSATLAIPVEDIAAVVRAVERMNGDVITEGEGAIIRLPSFTLRLLPAWERPGLRRLEFNLVRDATANPVFRFGPRSRLRFGPGRIAVWDFALP
jgi:hypothetical protein